MAIGDRRVVPTEDRRAVPRGGRRPQDQAGRYPPVLIADSDDGVRKTFARYLNKFGFDVTEAPTLDAAVNAVYGAPRPRVIVTEWRSVTPLYLESSSRPPIIVTATDELRPHPQHAAAVLVKPFALKTLLDEVRRVLHVNAPLRPAIG
jgi:DNA-binding response OmpR family regulator